jgi:hypothetical protein
MPTQGPSPGSVPECSAQRVTSSICVGSMATTAADVYLPLGQRKPNGITDTCDACCVMVRPNAVSSRCCAASSKWAKQTFNSRLEHLVGPRAGGVPFSAHPAIRFSNLLHGFSKEPALRPLVSLCNEVFGKDCDITPAGKSYDSKAFAVLV